MLSNRTMVQNGWIVDDLQAAVKKWIDFYGVGPFWISEKVVPDNVLYRGTPAHLEMSVALAHAGNVQIELIQQKSDGPSAYRDQFNPGQGGFHHACYHSDDYDADKALFEANGYVAATEGSIYGGELRFAYFDTRADFGIFTEIVTPNEAFRASNQKLKDASENWDGKDPIRINTPDGGYRVP
jgi:hypothetical protein